MDLSKLKVAVPGWSNPALMDSSSEEVETQAISVEESNDVSIPETQNPTDGQEGVSDTPSVNTSNSKDGSTVVNGLRQKC